MPQRELNDWELISLLRWKNWAIFLNNPLSFILSTLSPATFVIFLIVIRFTIDTEKHESVDYPKILLKDHWRILLRNNSLDADKLRNATNGEFNYNVFIPQNALAYAPNDDKGIEKIMKTAETLLHIQGDDEPDLTAVYSYKNSHELYEAMKRHNYLAGIVFAKDEIDKKTDLPKKLNFTLVFPSEVRDFMDNCIGSHWRTNSLFDPYYKYLQRYPNRPDGGYVGYFREGFVAIQRAVSISYIMLKTDKKMMDLPFVQMSRFKLPATSFDPFLDNMYCCLSLAIIVGYLYPTTALIRDIVNEKRLLLKDALYIYGVNETVQFVSWFIYGLGPFFIASVIVVILLKVQWHEGYGVFSVSDWTTLIVYFLAYNIASVCFCYLISTCFKHTHAAVVIHSFIWIFTYFPYTVTILRLKNHWMSYVVIILFSNTAMAVAIEHMIDYEQLGDGFGWGTIFYKLDDDDVKMPAGAIVLILLGQAVAYTLIGLTIEGSKNKAWFQYCTYCIACMPLRRLISWVRGICQGIPDSTDARNSLPELSFAKSISPAPSKKTSRLDLTKSDSATTSKIRSKTEVIEIESMNKKIIVEVKNLNLVIDNTTVVHNVSMDLYENEITVLMGANGSGKSMLLSMMVGRIPATSGNILINGLKIENVSVMGHSFMGVSLNEDALYPDLTVSDQIAFFSRMKGFSGNRLRFNVRKYLNAMNLSSKANLITKTLTRGLKQHLSVCCALCGDSKFVVIDEPSTAMDMSARKLLWDLLIKERRRRTILIATQSVDEAEILADRIGIMANGKMKCFGSPFFLKSFYTAGKRLTCTKDVNCDIDVVTKFIRNYIPRIRPESDLCNELSFRIVLEDLDVLVKLLANIERNLKELKLSSFSITELTFEDIFLNMCEDDSSGDNAGARIKRLMNGYSIYVKDYDLLYFLRKDSNKQSKTKELRAVFLKRWYTMKGNMAMTILLFALLPALIVYISIYLPSSSIGKEILKPITYRLLQYRRSNTVCEQIDKNDKFVSKMVKRYRRNVERQGSVHKFLDTEFDSMSDYIINRRQAETLRSPYLVGATFGKDVITAWFNNYPLHTVPLSLNMVYNAILQAYVPSSEITIRLKPLPFSTPLDPDQLLLKVSLANVMGFHIAFVMCCMYSIAILAIITERVSTLKLLQYVNGLQPFAYLIGNLSYDLLKVLVLGLIIIVIVAVAESKIPYGLDIAMYYFMMLAIFSFSMGNFSYCMATFFNNPITGNICVLLFTVYEAVLFVMIQEIYQDKYTYNNLLDEKYMWVLRLFPVFSFCTALNKIIGCIKLIDICSDEVIKMISADLKEGEAKPNCCFTPKLLEWGNEYSIIPEIFCILAFGVICMILFFVWEFNAALRVSSFGKGTKKKESMIFGGLTQLTQKALDLLMNPSVAQEKKSILNLQPSEYITKPLVMRNVSKSYGRGIAVHQLYLKVEHGECVGILGINGSGKSTIIKLLTGHEILTVGQVYVKGIRMQTNLYDVYKNVGMCPKPKAIPREYTVYEMMKVLCILRGISDAHIPMTCINLARILGFIKYLYIEFGKLSSGNKLRVCAALAMIGGPTIMYYDVITAGIDPAGCRQLWNIFGRMLKIGKSVLFTTFNTEECARICTRLAIMDDGTFQYLDTPHNLSNNYMKGVLLYVRVKPKNIGKRASTYSTGRFSDEFSNPSTARSSNASQNRWSLIRSSLPRWSGAGPLPPPNLNAPSPFVTNPFIKVQTFVEHMYPHAIVKDQRGHVIIFYIPGDTTSLSDVYKQIGRNVFNLNVVNFSLTRTTLETLFCDLAEAKVERERTADVDGIID